MCVLFRCAFDRWVRPSGTEASVTSQLLPPPPNSRFGRRGGGYFCFVLSPCQTHTDLFSFSSSFDKRITRDKEVDQVPKHTHTHIVRAFFWQGSRESQKLKKQKKKQKKTWPSLYLNLNRNETGARERRENSCRAQLLSYRRIRSSSFHTIYSRRLPNALFEMSVRQGDWQDEL